MTLPSGAPSQDDPAIQAAQGSPADEYATEAARKSKTLINLTELDGIKVLGISQADEEFYKSCTETFRRKVYQKVRRGERARVRGFFFRLGWADCKLGRLIAGCCRCSRWSISSPTSIGPTLATRGSRGWRRSSNSPLSSGVLFSLSSSFRTWYWVSPVFATVHYLFLGPYLNMRLAEIPSNMAIRHCRRPSRYIGPLVTLWGLVMIGHAFVHNLAGLLALRALLGVFQ